MSVELVAPQPEPTGWRRGLRDAENFGVTLALLAMMLLPVIVAFVSQFSKSHVYVASPLLESSLPFASYAYARAPSPARR